MRHIGYDGAVKSEILGSGNEPRHTISLEFVYRFLVFGFYIVQGRRVGLRGGV